VEIAREGPIPRVDRWPIVVNPASARSKLRPADGLEADKVAEQSSDQEPNDKKWPVSASNSADGFVARALSVAWALVPVATVGLGTAPAFTYAAVRLRSKAVRWWTAFYWLCLATALVFDRPGEVMPESSWRSQAQEWIQWIALILMGTTHAFLIRRRLLEGTRDSDEGGVDGGRFRALGIPPPPTTEGFRDA